MIIELFKILCVIIIAIIFGKLFQKIRLPSVLGWLLVGIIFGPYAISLLTTEIIAHNYIYEYGLAVAEIYIGIFIGIEISLKEIKKSAKEIAIVTIFESFGTYFIVASSFFLFMFIHPEYNGNLIEILLIALCFGSIALATAPAPSLMIIKEYSAKGPLSKFLVSLAALDDIIAILVFVITALLTRSYFTGDAINYVVIFKIAGMIFGSIIFGALIGFVTRKFWSGIKNFKIFSLLFLLVPTLIAILIHLSHLPLSLLLFGLGYAVVFINFCKYNTADRIQHQLKIRISPVIEIFLLVYIVDMGAALDWKTILGAGIPVVIYVIFRGAGKIAFTYIGAGIAKSPTTVRKFLGLALLPHAGVSLFFTGKLIRLLSEIEGHSNILQYITLFSGTIAAVALINEIIAVLLAKKAFKMSGEIE